jgi:hypothetical protein
MRKQDLERVLAGLAALYNDRARGNAVAALIHDADFLAKFGALGVAGFFLKSALRGRGLSSAVTRYLSKELTYAACLPANMRTKAGRKLAGRKAAETLRFYRRLLAEMREAQIAAPGIRRMRVPHPRRRGRSLDVLLVRPRTCTGCGGRWESSLSTEEGIKCLTLSIDSSCRRCGMRLETSFCLPELAP